MARAGRSRLGGLDRRAVRSSLIALASTAAFFRPFDLGRRQQSGLATDPGLVH